MLVFACAFVAPLCLAIAFGPQPATVVAASACLVAVVRFRAHPRATLALVSGAALFVVRLPALERSWIGAPAPRTAVVVVAGVVAGPCRETGVGVQVPIDGGPWISVPDAREGPLPGTRVRALGRMEPGGRVIRVGGPAGLVVTQRTGTFHVPALVERARRSARERLGCGLRPRTANMLRALVLGDRLSSGTRERMAQTGTLHFFAVSGLHLALLAAALTRMFGPRARWLLPALVTYAAISGFRTPVGRALLMVASVVGARAFRRPHRALPHLLLAATIILTLHPRALTSAGFLLSFSAYAGIVGIALPALARRRRDPLRQLEAGLGATGPWREHLIAILWVSVAALAASLPVTVVLFQRITPGAVPASLLLGPLVPALLLAAVVLLVVPGFFLARWVAEACASTLDTVVGIIDATPGASFEIARPYGAAVVAYTITLLAAAYVTRTTGRVARPALAVLIATLPLAVAHGPPPGFRLLHAGRGSALLVTHEEGHVLVDAGPREARVAEKLLSHGVRRLQRMVITHEHEDHAGGRRNVRARLVVEGEGVHGLSRFQQLWPTGDVADLGANDRSVVLRIMGRRHRLLVTGDLETRGLRRLLERASPLDADVLVLPHHGARNDALPDLLLRAAPDHVWLPARPGFADEASMLTVLWSGIPLETTWAATRGCHLRDAQTP